jgi:hypothetical protein
VIASDTKLITFRLKLSLAAVGLSFIDYKVRRPSSSSTSAEACQELAYCFFYRLNVDLYRSASATRVFFNVGDIQMDNTLCNRSSGRRETTTSFSSSSSSSSSSSVPLTSAYSVFPVVLSRIRNMFDQYPGHRFFRDQRSILQLSAVILRSNDHLTFVPYLAFLLQGLSVKIDAPWFRLFVNFAIQAVTCVHHHYYQNATTISSSKPTWVQPALEPLPVSRHVILPPLRPMHQLTFGQIFLSPLHLQVSLLNSVEESKQTPNAPGLEEFDPDLESYELPQVEHNALPPPQLPDSLTVLLGLLQRSFSLDSGNVGGL